MKSARARAYNRAIAIARNHALALIRDLGHAHARDVLSARARALIRDLDRVHAPALVSTYYFASARIDHLTTIRDRALALAFTLDRALALDRDFERASAFDRFSTRDRELERAADHARGIVIALNRARNFAASEANQIVISGIHSKPGRMTWTLVALAVSLLPVVHRPRYREVFASELVELPRRKRLGYALRVLARVRSLRQALLDTVRTPDGEPARRAER